MNKEDVGQLWLRAVGGYNEFEDKSGQINTDGHHYVLQAGIGLANFGERGNIMSVLWPHTEMQEVIQNH